MGRTRPATERTPHASAGNNLALKMASSAQPSLTRLLRRLEQSGPLTLKAGHEPLMKTAPLQGIYFTTVSQCYRV